MTIVIPDIPNEQIGTVTTTGGGGGPVTAVSGAFVDGAITTLGSEADAAVTNPATNATVIAYLRGILTQLADTLADGDFLTTIATNTTGVATSANQSTGNTSLGSIKTDLDEIATDTDNLANIPAKGTATTANSMPVNIASDQVVPMKLSTVAVYSLASTTSTGSTQNSGDLTVGAYREVSLDINTTAQSGTSPTVQFFYERKAADGIYYVLWQSAVLTVAANTLSTSIGAGMAFNQSLGVTGRLRWVVGGSATPTYTFSANIQGK